MIDPCVWGRDDDRKKVIETLITYTNAKGGTALCNYVHYSANGWGFTQVWKLSTQNLEHYKLGLLCVYSNFDNTKISEAIMRNAENVSLRVLNHIVEHLQGKIVAVDVPTFESLKNHSAKNVVDTYDELLTTKQRYDDIIKKSGDTDSVTIFKEIIKDKQMLFDNALSSLCNKLNKRYGILFNETDFREWKTCDTQVLGRLIDALEGELLKKCSQTKAEWDSIFSDAMI